MLGGYHTTVSVGTGIRQTAAPAFLTERVKTRKLGPSLLTPSGLYAVRSTKKSKRPDVAPYFDGLNQRAA